MFEWSLPSIGLEQIARQMKSVRQVHGLKTVLVLGSRAGAIFRRPALRYIVQALATPQIQAASYAEQFTWCFQRLTKMEQLSKTEQYALLTSALAHVTLSEADRCLARLITQGYFDPIILAGADTLLEQALREAGWQPLHHFEVIDLTIETGERIILNERRSVCSLLQVFGSLTNRQYVLSSRYAHIGKMGRHQILSQVLGRDCLIVGFDETWDESLYQLFPPPGDTCWLIAEQANERFCTLNETRNVSLLHQKDCVSYEAFFVRLHSLLTERTSASTTIHPVLAAPSHTPMIERQQLDTLDVFISYHESDEFHLHRLVEHLATLKREGLIKDWFKSKLQAGQAVSQETQQYISKSTVFLLLISSPFIASDVLYQQMQQMIERHHTKKALVIPILLRPADWQNTPLKTLAPLPDNGLFVTIWPNYDSAFLNIIQGIRRAITDYRN